jgi:hypothetical protein
MKTSERRPLPSLERLQHLFELDPKSPSGLRWKNVTSNRMHVGDVAGAKTKEGYWTVSVDYCAYRVHRIVFYLKTGENPAGFDVDHIDGVSNVFNLRIATPSQNQGNRKKTKSKYSEFKGVTWDRARNKWKAHITINKKTTNLGRFTCEIECAKVYNEAAIKHFGKYARLNDVSAIPNRDALGD